MIVDYSEAVATAGGYGNKPTEENSNHGLGHIKVISHNKLYGQNSRYMYINNDILCIMQSV